MLTSSVKHSVVLIYQMCHLLGCHGNGCTGYSAVLIISMVNYKTLIHDQLCHILLIMLFLVKVMRPHITQYCMPGFFETQCSCQLKCLRTRSSEMKRNMKRNEEMLKPVTRNQYNMKTDSGLTVDRITLWMIQWENTSPNCQSQFLETELCKLSFCFKFWGQFSSVRFLENRYQIFSSAVLHTPRQWYALVNRAPFLAHKSFYKALKLTHKQRQTTEYNAS